MNLYREFPPSPALAAHVACLWTAQAVPSGGALRHRVLPDNCIDILWQDAAPLGFVAGMMSRAHVAEFTRPVRTVAVRFLPGAARAFFDIPLSELQDGHPALDTLWPRAEAERLAAALWERELPLEAMFAVIETWLLARLSGTARSPLAACTSEVLHSAAAARGRPAARYGSGAATRAVAPDVRADQLVRSAVTLIERSRGVLRVEALAASLGVSRQHLAQVFRERVGLNAKSFAMVCRFQSAHAALQAAGGDIDWPAFALNHGYYDQSHLIHDFTALTGASPGQLQR